MAADDERTRARVLARADGPHEVWQDAWPISGREERDEHAQAWLGRALRFARVNGNIAKSMASRTYSGWRSKARDDRVAPFTPREWEAPKGLSNARKARNALL